MMEEGKGGRGWLKSLLKSRREIEKRGAGWRIVRREKPR